MKTKTQAREAGYYWVRLKYPADAGLAKPLVAYYHPEASDYRWDLGRFYTESWRTDTDLMVLSERLLPPEDNDNADR